MLHEYNAKLPIVVIPKLSLGKTILPPKGEQGTVAGAKAEASLMANQLETNASRRKKYGTGADGLQPFHQGYQGG